MSALIFSVATSLRTHNLIDRCNTYHARKESNISRAFFGNTNCFDSFKNLFPAVLTKVISPYPCSVASPYTVNLACLGSFSHQCSSIVDVLRHTSNVLEIVRYICKNVVHSKRKVLMLLVPSVSKPVTLRLV